MLNFRPLTNPLLIREKNSIFKMNKKLLPLLALMCLPILLSAQHFYAKDAITVRRLAMNYRLPFNMSTQNLFKTEDYNNGLELAYTRNLNKFLNLSVPFRGANVSLPLSGGEFQEEMFVMGMDAIAQFGYFNKSHWVTPYVYVGVGGMLEDMSKFSYSTPAGLGLNVRIGANFAINLQSEYRMGYPSPRNSVQHGVGISVLFGDDKRMSKADREKLAAEELAEKSDIDGDGVLDKFDQCPDMVGTKETGGCPDMDGDGISDAEDDCPNEKGLADLKGCPIVDSDGDGIADHDDNCPNEVGLKEDQGCPVPDTDIDGDGIMDKDDACPNIVGIASNRGCPGIDTDADGIIDDEDRCPNIVGVLSNKGCPEIKDTEKTTLDMAMRTVRFDFRSNQLTESSKPILREVVDILNSYPSYKMRLNGYSDSIGSRKDNLELSQKRAKMCYNYLIAQGIAKDRLSYQGRGEAAPIATNMYKDGRELNRRVEFEIYVD